MTYKVNRGARKEHREDGIAFEAKNDRGTITVMVPSYLLDVRPPDESAEDLYNAIDKALATFPPPEDANGMEWRIPLHDFQDM